MRSILGRGIRKIQRWHHAACVAGLRRANFASIRLRDDLALLLAPGGIGIELGVGGGGFSEKILKRSALSYLYSVDMWAEGGHNIDEYRAAFHRLNPFRTRSSILKMKFNEALPLFPDAYFDFIYVDGYAHTGEEGGQTFRDWFPTLKPGGVFAGDDYTPKWPLVVEQVDAFVAAMNLKMYVVPGDETVADGYAQSPSWFAFKDR